MLSVFTIPKPKVLTVASLRNYLDDVEAVWTEQDTKFLGKFEDQDFGIIDRGIAKCTIHTGTAVLFLITSVTE